MKSILLIGLVLSLVGCSSFKPKRTDFYKDGKIVKSVVGRGVFDGNDWFGTYKIWAPEGWKFYEYHCDGCNVVETELSEKK
jgi:hypothetical protein